LWKNFDAVDLWIFDVAGESDQQFAVLNFHRNAFHICLERAAGLGPNIEVLELVPLDTEREHALAWTGNALVGFGEMQLYHILPIGHGPRK